MPKYRLQCDLNRTIESRDMLQAEYDSLREETQRLIKELRSDPCSDDSYKYRVIPDNDDNEKYKVKQNVFDDSQWIKQYKI